MAGRTSAAITEQVRQASDIVDVVSSYVRLKRAGTAFKGLCPFHREKAPSFQVNPERQIFKCFGCGAGGDVFKFIQMRENVSFMEAKTILATRAGISIEEEARPNDRPAGPSKTDLERTNRWASRWFQQQLAGSAGRNVRGYLENRGISEESVRRFALGYAPDSWDSLRRAAAERGIPSQLLSMAGLTKENPDTGNCYDAFRNRLIFPIQDVMARTIGFGGRTLGEDPAKYLNSPQSALFDKKRCLYGLDSAKEAFREHRTAVVVEGYVDCIMAQQYGFGQTVATLGTALTIEHVRLLRRYVDAVILVFDSDEAGRRAADQSLSLFLTEQLDVRLAEVPEAKDPADLLLAAGAEAFQHVLTSAQDALEFKWKQVLQRYRNDATGPMRRRAIEEFLGLIASSADLGACEPIQRGLILNQVGKLLGLSSEEVHRQLRIVARRSGPVRGVDDGGPRSERAPVTPDAACAAMRELLGVLLNEPSYYASIATEFDPGLIPDRATREIAQAVVETAQEDPDFTLPALISRFESVETAKRIVALQTAAETRGNVAATVEGAVQCLQRLREQRRNDDLESGLRKVESRVPSEAAGEVEEGVPRGQPEGKEMDERSIAQALRQGVRNAHGFAARRHLSASRAADAGQGGSQRVE
ncbi:MAG: DNA primase [Phycisphaerae bacterium]|nr:DNA primase [Phycisphaerae bacterium]